MIFFTILKPCLNQIIAEAKKIFVLDKTLDHQRSERRKETYRWVDLNSALTFPQLYCRFSSYFHHRTVTPLHISTALPRLLFKGLRPGVSYCQNMAQLLVKLAVNSKMQIIAKITPNMILVQNLELNILQNLNAYPHEWWQHNGEDLNI